MRQHVERDSTMSFLRIVTPCKYSYLISIYYFFVTASEYFITINYVPSVHLIATNVQVSCKTSE
jgi:hypothetical protein